MVTAVAEKKSGSSLKLPTRALSPALGAEIMSVDLSKPLDDDVFQAILDIWHENLVILLRDQTLDEDDQVRFASRFGTLNRSHKKRAHHSDKNDAVMYISNIRENGQLIGALPDGEMHFHTDQSHQEKPSAATMLYSIEVPSKGGNTLFANAYKAYETLPEDVRRKIEGRRAINAYDYDNAGTRRGTVLRPDVPSATHPIVRTHPDSGRKALYVNRLMTVAIEGMDTAESEELLNFLFDHQEQTAFVYEHVWRPKDLIMWDNRCTLHARTDFSAEERRLMRRVTILGEKPV
jgi:taurine dioxygenase